MTCPLDPRGLSLKPRFDSPSKSSPDRDSDSTLGGVCGIDSRYMKRAALYARVSGDLQAKEGTIESQVLALQKQIAAPGPRSVCAHAGPPPSACCPAGGGRRSG